jgi:aquaporin Z
VFDKGFWLELLMASKVRELCQVTLRGSARPAYWPSVCGPLLPKRGSDELGFLAKTLGYASSAVIVIPAQRTNVEEIMADTKKLLAELFGSYILLTIGGFAIVSTALGVDGSLVIPLGFGLGLLIGLYMFGEVSGGHYNPAVSLAALLDGRVDVAAFAMYVVAQIIGFVLAGYTIAWAFGEQAVAATMTMPNRGAGVTDLDTVLLEILGTALLVGVILRVTKSDVVGSTAFLGIGLTLAGLAIAFGGFTGGSFNPGRSIGSAVAAGDFTNLWLYIVGPLIGGIVAWGAYKITEPDDADTEDDEPVVEESVAEEAGQ